MVPTTQRQKIAANYHKLHVPQWPTVIDAMTWHDTAFVGLMVGQPAIVEIEGRPERIIGANGKAYVPPLRVRTPIVNCYVHVASKAMLEAERPRLEPLLSSFAAKRHAEYRFVSHEWIDLRAATAWFWLKISRWALQYADHALTRECDGIKRTVEQAGEGTLEELISHHAHLAPVNLVAAICKLLCAHTVSCPNSDKPFGWHTRVVPAPRKRPENLPEMEVAP